MFSSIRTRLWLTYAIVISVVLAILFIAIFVYLARNPFEIRQTIQRLKIINTLIIQREYLPLIRNSKQINNILLRADQAFDVRILIFDPNGVMVEDTRSGKEEEFPSIKFLKPNLALSDNTIRDASGKTWLFSLRINQDGYRIIVATPRPRAPILSLFRDELLFPFFQAGLIALLLALLFSLWIAQWLAAPLQRIGKAAKQLANGEYEDIHLEGPQEVRDLATNFNEMSNRVRSSQQSQRDLVANVSHELKTPLTSIQGFAQAMLDGTVESSEDIRKAAEVIFSESSRMNRLVLELLDLAKLDSGLADFHFSKVDIGKLVSEVIDRIRPVATQKEIQINKEINESIQIDCDLERISQVISNLMDNAIKFSPPKSMIEIQIERDNQYVNISIRDQGSGIPQSDIGRVFERFYQIDKSRSAEHGKGVGLGLTIAKEIVMKHGGTIQVYNNQSMDDEQTGCTFVVSLPISQ